MTHMAQTSLLAYRSLERIGAKQQACYRAIKNLGSASNYDIAQYLGWDVNRVTGRCKELRELNFVEEAYRDLCPATNRTVIYWRLVDRG